MTETENIGQSGTDVDPEIAAMMAGCEAKYRAAGRIRSERPERASCAPGQVSGQKTKSSNPAIQQSSNPAIQQSRSSGIDRSQPPEKDFEQQRVGSSEREFHAAVDVKQSDRVLLDYFAQHYLAWVPMLTLSEVSGCHAVHSRIPEVRLMIPADHDIDQASIFYHPTGKLHSHYRLCLKTDSLRLKRLADRRSLHDGPMADANTEPTAAKRAVR